MKETPFIKILRMLLGYGQPLINWLRKAVYTLDARRLNGLLFEDVNSIGKEELDDARKRLKEFCTKRGCDQNEMEIWDTHLFRILLTRNWIGDIVSDLPAGAIAMDMGVESVSSDFWRSQFPQIKWQNTDWDVRYPWKSSEASADLIVCTELIEHLSDQPNDIFNEGFYKSGFVAFARESYRALKPGGYLFLTTPNGASIFHVRLSLQGKSSWYFDKHVREYTMEEVLTVLQNAGFQVVKQRDIHCLTTVNHPNHSHIFRLLLENDFPASGRGDDLFVLVQKPAVSSDSSLYQP